MDHSAGNYVFLTTGNWREKNKLSLKYYKENNKRNFNCFVNKISKNEKLIVSQFHY